MEGTSGKNRFYIMKLTDETKNQNIYYDGWEKPGTNELKAFSGELGIDGTNYSSYGLKKEYSSSSSYTESQWMRGPNGPWLHTTTYTYYLSFPAKAINKSSSIKAIRLVNQF